MRTPSSDIGRDSSEFTILLASSPIPSHPSIRLISKVLNSLRLITDLRDNTKIIIAQDGCDDPSVKPAYDQYLRKLDKYRRGSRLNITVALNDKQGHLTGNIRNAMQFVDTEYVLMMQHDLPFVSAFRIYPVIEDMECNPSIKHVRFNQRKNIKAKWDAQSDLFGKQIQGTNYQYTRTGSWSDQNHLSTVGYYQSIVLKEVADGRFMESVLNERSHKDHERYGTYIFGKLNFPAMIQHIKGRNSSRFAVQDTVKTFYDRVSRKIGTLLRLV